MEQTKEAEQAAWDVYGTEILPGDELVINNITGETILKENLMDYLIKFHNFHLKTAE